MKKILTLVFALALSLTIISCSGVATTEEGLVDGDTVVQTDEQVIALEAVSSTMLLSYVNTSVDEMAVTTEVEDVLGEDEIDELDYYVEMVEAFLGNDQLTIDTQTSDIEGYDYMVVFTTSNLEQDAVVYKLYYNVFDLVDEEVTTEEPVTTEEEVTTEEPATTEEPTTVEATTEAPTTEAPPTEAPTTEAVTTEASTTLLSSPTNESRPFRFLDEDDEYVVQGLEGILVVGETTYEIEGKILEIDGKQIVRIRSYIDDDNYVLVNYQTDETEVDKEKFFFQLVEGGTVITRSRVSIFESDNMQHVQLEFIDGDNYERYQFHMRTEDNVTYIHINYVIETETLSDSGNIHLTKTVDEVTGEVTYTYDVLSDHRAQGPQGNQMQEHHRNHGMGGMNDRERPNNRTEL